MHSKDLLLDPSILEKQSAGLFKIDAPMYSRWVLLADLLLLPVAFGISLLVFHSGFFYQQLFSVNLFMVMAAHIGAYWATGRYSMKQDVMSAGYLVEHGFITFGIGLALSLYLLGVMYFFSPGMMPLKGVIATGVIYGFGSWYMRREIYQITSMEENSKELIVLGTGERAQKFFHTLQEKKPYRHYSFFSVDSTTTSNFYEKTKGIDKRRRHLIPDDYSSPVVKTDLLTHLKKSRRPIGSIVIAEESSCIPKILMKQLVSAKFSHIEVKTLAHYYADKWYSIPEYDLSPFWNLEENNMGIEGLFSYGTLKRTTDVLVAGTALLLLSPLALILGLSIRLESRGPALFKQKRVGLKGKNFTICKFRSMSLGSEKGDVYTRQGDKRITRLGGFMRKTRLDEIPQLWNILKGDMSLIGPRPEWDVLVDRYEDEIDFYHFRHLVRPGLTGWAQVNYSYGSCLRDTIEKLKYDLYYVQKSSPKLDLMVIVKTIYTIVGFKGL